MKVYCIPVGMLQTNCYILACEDTKKAVIVDPGDEGPKIDSLIKNEGLDPILVVNTHAHYDHIGANRYFHDKGIPVAIHKLDSKLMMAGGGAEILGSRSVPNPAPDRYLEEGGVDRDASARLDRFRRAARKDPDQLGVGILTNGAFDAATEIAISVNCNFHSNVL